MKKIVFVIGVLLLLSRSNIQASDFRFTNEINDIRLSKDKRSLIVEGWGFLFNVQNYYNNSTHSYVLELKGKNDYFEIAGKQTSISQTDTMYFVGSRYCKNNEFYNNSTKCNNYYNNVGFYFEIPLSKIKMNENYKVKLGMTAKQAKVTKKTDVYFPNKKALEFKEKHRTYTIDSKLHNIGVKVLDSNILVRDKPSKRGKILTGNRNCSADRKLYYKKGAYFKNVYDKVIRNNTSYYRLKGKRDGCSGRMSVINEGGTYDPIWIASTFIEHIGETLTIKAREFNTPPVLNVGKDLVIKVDDSFNPWSGVSAYDKEDGDLSHKIRIKSNTFKNKVGTYKVVYAITDSFNTTVRKQRNISVLRRNYPPQIATNDISILQYSAYNPFDYAKAFDQDKKDITHKLKSLSTIDTSKLGIQRQCYEVVDDYNLKTQKCMNVDIIKGKSSYRFIQHKNLFYKEEIPKGWIKHLKKLKAEINNEIAYDQRHIRYK